jgi:hypothetical protein
MIREEKFVLSKRPYAVDLNSFRETDWGNQFSINAVWFRRRRSQVGLPIRTVACIGDLSTFGVDHPETAIDFMERYTDGRYGGNCIGRWDGEGYWGDERPHVQAEHLKILQPMLENYPELPPGHDGWWRFETRKELYG